jgi:hypothetical protein
MHVKSLKHISIAMFPPKKHYTQAGFEPRSSVPEVDVHCAPPPWLHMDLKTRIFDYLAIVYFGMPSLPF